MRENIKSIGLIFAILVAGISLPTSIKSFMDKPTQITEINNYYYNNTVIETYNNTIIERYNNTIIVWVNNTVVVNETIVEETPIPDRSKPVEPHVFNINTTHPHYIMNYTIGNNEVYQYLFRAYPLRAITYPRFTVVQSAWLDTFINSGYKDGDFFSSGFSGSGYWYPPFLDNWYFVVYYDSGMPYLANNWDWGLNDSITTIGI